MTKIVIADGQRWLVAGTAEWPESQAADLRLVEESRRKRALQHWHLALARAEKMLAEVRSENEQP
jgi:hypothetical protein